MPTWDEMCSAAEEVRARYDDINQRELGRIWDLTDFVLGFTGDVGDLAKLVMAHQGHRADLAADAGRIGHELSDCLFSLIVIAKESGVDLGDRFTTDMAALATRLRPATGPEPATGARVETPSAPTTATVGAGGRGGAAARTFKVEPTGPEV
ncbi:hypothetical protein [Kitasatospora sp. NPDC088548]|uniref:hypothetical protein n=1 Tax=Kitasatospora sp. NPDC088548 TaxID=3364075 RepID=UPI00381E201A